MSWYLEVDLVGATPRRALGAFVDAFAPSASGFRWALRGAGWMADDVASGDLDPGLEAALDALPAPGPGECLRVEASLAWEVAPPHTVIPTLSIAPAGEASPGAPGRRRAPIVVDLGKRAGYGATGRLVGGRVPDEAMAAALVAAIASASGADGAWLPDEHQVSVPVAELVVYRARAADFAAELVDLARLALGTGGLGDDRDTYDALLSPAANPMLFGRRRPAEREALQAALADHRRTLERLLAGDPVPLSVIEEASLSEAVTVLPTPVGLALAGARPLVDPLAPFYLACLDHLAERL